MDIHTIGDRAGTVHMPEIPSFSDSVLGRDWCLEHMARTICAFSKISFGERASGHIPLRDSANPESM
jgi:hypothetical protein